MTSPFHENLYSCLGNGGVTWTWETLRHCIPHPLARSAQQKAQREYQNKWWWCTPIRTGLIWPFFCIRDCNTYDDHLAGDLWTLQNALVSNEQSLQHHLRPLYRPGLSFWDSVPPQRYPTIPTFSPSFFQSGFSCCCPKSDDTVANAWRL